jgi:tetratricopeptide (TPR) repeat protein
MAGLAVSSQTIPAFAQKLEEHLTSKINNIDANKVRRNKALLQLAFQPSNEHRLLGIRMAIKKAQIQGNRRVYLVNAEYSGAISGLPMQKARALYTKTDTNIAIKEARRLGWKTTTPAKIPTYLDESLALAPSDYRDLVIASREEALASHNKRVELVKRLFPKAVLADGVLGSKRVVLEGLSPELESALAETGKNLGYGGVYYPAKDFAYADNTNTRNITSYRDTNGEFIYTMDGEFPLFSIDKLMQLAHNSDSSPNGMANRLAISMTNEMGNFGDESGYSHLRQAKKIIEHLSWHFEIHKYSSSNLDFLNEFRDALADANALYTGTQFSTGLGKLDKAIGMYAGAINFLKQKEEFLRARGMKADSAMADIASLGIAWLQEGSDYAKNYRVLLSNPRYADKSVAAFDFFASKMMAIEIPDSADYSPVAKKEAESGSTPFYKPKVSASPNDRPFKNEFFTDGDVSSGLKRRVKLYAYTKEDEDKYVYIVSLKRLDGNNVDESNHASEYMGVVSKNTREATVMQSSSDYDSEYAVLARAETIARLGAFGVTRFDEPNKGNATKEPEIGQPVVVNKTSDLNKENESVVAKPVSQKNMPKPVATWNNRTAGYGTTLTTTDGYYIMAMNNKFRLYNAQQVLVGVYSDEEEAKRKAEALRKKGKPR